MGMMASMTTMIGEPTFVDDATVNGPRGSSAPLGTAAQQWWEVTIARGAAANSDSEAMQELSAATTRALQLGITVRSSQLGIVKLALVPLGESSRSFYLVSDVDSFVRCLALPLLEEVRDNDAVAISAAAELEDGRARFSCCPQGSAQQYGRSRG